MTSRSVRTLLTMLAVVTAMIFISMNEVSAEESGSDGEARTVLITGANRGLGFEFARQYSAAGWRVIGTARKPATATDLKDLGVRVLQLDVADAQSVAAMAAALADEPIDLLINNAGMANRDGMDFETMDFNAVERVLAVNTIGPMRVTRALLPNLRAGKGKQIVHVTSGLGSIEENTGGGYYGYRESKAALNMFNRSLAWNYKDEGFTSVVMSPGWVRTDMGGPEANLSPEESITGMKKVIDGLTIEDTGTFQSWNGTLRAW